MILDLTAERADKRTDAFQIYLSQGEYIVYFTNKLKVVNYPLKYVAETNKNLTVTDRDKLVAEKEANIKGY